MVVVMERLGFPRFSVAGHDRGGRVAYRMALDHPSCVDRLAVLDIVPTGTVWDRADARFALGYWPWALLAQPEPLPERILTAAPDAIIDDALGGWGSPSAVFPPEVRAAYVQALRDPAHAHAICEEYRAAATLDREHDKADQIGGRRIATLERSRDTRYLVRGGGRTNRALASVEP
jgi:haloacetate dehalogenase